VATLPPMDEAGIPALVEAIRHLHGLEATWLRSEFVREEFNGETVWQGDVECFAVKGHPVASEAYAWSYATEAGKRRFMAILGMSPVTDARKAVQAAIAAGQQK
jgi:hypothetical protein